MSNNNSEIIIPTENTQINNIIQEQSDQMLSMVDIINIYESENKQLTEKNNLLTNIFNRQLLLFALLFIMFYLIHRKHCNKCY